MITYERKEIENLAFHAEKLVDYLIDDEARHYSETKDSAIDCDKTKHDLDNHIYHSVAELARIVKYKRLDHVKKEWEI